MIVLTIFLTYVFTCILLAIIIKTFCPGLYSTAKNISRQTNHQVQNGKLRPISPVDSLTSSYRTKENRTTRAVAESHKSKTACAADVWGFEKCYNEYTRIRGDTGGPDQLIEFMATNYRKLVKDIECRKKTLQIKSDQNRQFKKIEKFVMRKAVQLTGHQIVKRGLTDGNDAVYLEEAGNILLKELEECKRATDEAEKEIAKIEDELAEFESTQCQQHCRLQCGDCSLVQLLCDQTINNC